MAAAAVSPWDLRRPPAASRRRGKAGGNPGPSASAGPRCREQPLAVPRAGAGAPIAPTAPVAPAWWGAERGAGRGAGCWIPSRRRLGAAHRCVPGPVPVISASGIVPAAGALRSCWGVVCAPFFFLKKKKIVFFNFLNFFLPRKNLGARFAQLDGSAQREGQAVPTGEAWPNF